VVVCTHNGAATIAECLEGGTALDYPNFEVLVINDGSTDRTAEIAADFDVRVISTQNNTKIVGTFLSF
jgi:glycosyltransferase involved in cell wall biosynthesis